ncbi:MAG: hypothetical protein LBP73_11540 [Clostridiales Family XIII bacterium]|jgi:hypothetical protein|nr:hypothetical protein [Clostridiales Family XIII bacterium]
MLDSHCAASVHNRPKGAETNAKINILYALINKKDSEIGDDKSADASHTANPASPITPGPAG